MTKRLIHLSDKAPILIIGGNQNGIFNTAAQKTTNEQASQQKKNQTK